MNTSKMANRVIGLAVAGLGGVAFVASLQIADSVGTREGMNPRTLPMIVSVSLLAAGLGLAASSLRPQAEDTPIAWPDRGGWRRILITLVSLVAYMATLQPLGFGISTLLFIAFLVWYLGRYHPLVSLGLGVVSALVLVVLFAVLLGLPFPVFPDLS